MYNNEPKKNLRPHLGIKIKDDVNNQNVDAGAVWFKSGPHGFYMSGKFNQNVRLNPGQTFTVNVRDDQLKDILGNFFAQNPEPPKKENSNYNQGNQNYNQGNQNYNQGNNYNQRNNQGFKPLGQAVPNVAGNNYGGQDVEYDQYGNPVYPNNG